MSIGERQAAPARDPNSPPCAAATTLNPLSSRCFSENRVGQLMDVVRRFEGSHVRIVASRSPIPRSVPWCDSLERCPNRVAKFWKGRLALVESDLIGVELPDSRPADACKSARH